MLLEAEGRPQFARRLALVLVQALLPAEVGLLAGQREAEAQPSPSGNRTAGPEEAEQEVWAERQGQVPWEPETVEAPLASAAVLVEAERPMQVVAQEAQEVA